MIVLSSVGEAREFIETRMPDKVVRLRYLSTLAGAIREVNRLAPDQWAVTITEQDRLRLVVGNYFTYTLMGDSVVWLVLDHEPYEAAKKQGKPKAGSFVQGWRESRGDEYPHYTVPRGPRKGQWLSTSGYYDLGLADPADWPKVERLLYGFIANAIDVGQHIRTATKAMHLSAVLQYMRQELVPDPAM